MSRRIDRRRFLVLSGGAAVAAAAYGALGAPTDRPLAKPAARRVLSKELHLTPGDLARGERRGLSAETDGLKLQRAGGSGQYLSPALKSDLTFSYAGLFWSGSGEEGDSLRFWLRTSHDGQQWSEWEEVIVEMPAGPLAQYDTYGSLIWADGARQVQFMAELRDGEEAPVLRRAGVVLLNPYDGPLVESIAETEAGAAGSAFAAEVDAEQEAERVSAAASGKPITFSREQWGADESLRFSGGLEVWPRTYVPAKKLVVHHTATSNSYYTVDDAKAQVRAVYTYHAKSLGWGDIGYNCLVDKFGNSYEGRRGRSGPGYDGPGGREILSEDVVGGHALAYNYGSSGIALLGSFCTSSECLGGTSPSSAMISKLKKVLEWECRRHGIDPQGKSDFLLRDGSWHRDLRNVVGHRDVFGTTCPGGNVYSMLSQIRRDVAAALTNSAAPAVSIASAPAEGTVKKGRVEYRWSGSGGSGGFKYSFYLEGWSLPSGETVVDYIRGFTSRASPAWSPWTDETRAQLCYVAAGLYTFHIRVKDASGRVCVYQPSRSFLGTRQSSVCDGALIQGTGPAVYLVKRGLKRHVPDVITFLALGLGWGDVNHISDSLLKGVPTGQPLLSLLADGNLLKGSGPAVYVMQSGRKRHVASLAVMTECGYGWDAVYTVSDSQLGSIPTGDPLSGPPCPHLSPPHGSLLKGTGPAVYLMQRGLKRHVPDLATFETLGFQWGNLNDIPDSSLEAILTGDPLLSVLADGSLLTGSGTAVYVMDGGKKRHVTSPSAMEACGYGWDAVQIMPDAVLDSIPIGDPLSGPPCPHLSPPEGNLIKGSDDPVYVMEGGLKRHVTSLEAFYQCGYEWGNVNHIADSSLANVLMGDNLTGEACP